MYPMSMVDTHWQLHDLLPTSALTHKWHSILVMGPGQKTLTRVGAGQFLWLGLDWVGHLWVFLGFEF